MHDINAEFLDIVDENGVAQETVKQRGAVHRNGDWHRTVHIWIRNSYGELLIQKRSPQKESYANMWDISCAGHVPAGMHVRDAAIKELEEELGITVSSESLIPLFFVRQQWVLNDGAYKDNEYTEVFLLQTDLKIESMRIDPAEVAQIKWISARELKSNIDSGNLHFVMHTDEYERLFTWLDSHAPTVGPDRE